MLNRLMEAAKIDGCSTMLLVELRRLSLLYIPVLEALNNVHAVPTLSSATQTGDGD